MTIPGNELIDLTCKCLFYSQHNANHNKIQFNSFIQEGCSNSRAIDCEDSMNKVLENKRIQELSHQKALFSKTTVSRMFLLTVFL